MDCSSRAVAEVPSIAANLTLPDGRKEYRIGCVT